MIRRSRYPDCHECKGEHPSAAPYYMGEGRYVCHEHRYTSPQEETVSISEAAKILGLSTASVRNWIKQGRVRSSKEQTDKGSMRYVIPKVDVEKEMAAGKE